MQTVQFLHAAFAEALPTIHARRLEALMAAVAALLQGRRLTLTALGRFLPGSSHPKHAIKRVDRLLDNRQSGGCSTGPCCAPCWGRSSIR